MLRAYVASKDPRVRDHGGKLADASHHELKEAHGREVVLIMIDLTIFTEKRQSKGLLCSSFGLLCDSFGLLCPQSTSSKRHKEAHDREVLLIKLQGWNMTRQHRSAGRRQRSSKGRSRR